MDVDFLAAVGLGVSEFFSVYKRWKVYSTIVHDGVDIILFCNV